MQFIIIQIIIITLNVRFMYLRTYIQFKRHW